jgi:Na+/melibiose symporter-like transporter
MSALPGWVAPLALFLVPLLVAVVVNRLFRHHRTNPNFVLAWFVAVCWISALVVIWRQVH